MGYSGHARGSGELAYSSVPPGYGGHSQGPPMQSSSGRAYETRSREDPQHLPQVSSLKCRGVAVDSFCACQGFDWLSSNRGYNCCRLQAREPLGERPYSSHSALSCTFNIMPEGLYILPELHAAYCSDLQYALVAPPQYSHARFLIPMWAVASPTGFGSNELLRICVVFAAAEDASAVCA